MTRNKGLPLCALGFLHSTAQMKSNKSMLAAMNYAEAFICSPTDRYMTVSADSEEWNSESLKIFHSGANRWDS
jgi:hypothetical protein